MSNPILLRLSHYFFAIKFWILQQINHASLYKILGLIFVGMMSRLVPHPPNMTAINAIALFGICSLGCLRLALFSIFAAMLPLDLILGFHSSMGSVYLSLGLIALMGYFLKPKKLLSSTLLLALSSLLFFLITNFGVWLSDSLYPLTAAGLSLCYTAAVPFLLNNLMGTLFYGWLLSGCLALAEPKMQRRTHTFIHNYAENN